MAGDYSPEQQADFDAIEHLEWEPCDSEFHHTGRNHSGEAKYLIRFHECEEPREDAFRCEAWVKAQQAVEVGFCRICGGMFKANEFFWVVAEV